MMMNILCLEAIAIKIIAFVAQLGGVMHLFNKCT